MVDERAADDSSSASDAPAAGDIETLLAQVRDLQAGDGGRIDPLGMFRIERLVARLLSAKGASAGPGDRGGSPRKASAALLRRLAAAIVAHHERVAQLRSRASADCACASAKFPESAAMLQRLLEAGDFRRLRYRIARLEGRGTSGWQADSLAALLASTGAGSSGAELRAVQRFQATWTRLRTTRHLEQSRAHAPRNAGPLNSHHLVLQALEQMRTLSPDYLQGFLTGVDTLLWLDRVVEAAGPAGNPTSKRRAGRRR